MNRKWVAARKKAGLPADLVLPPRRPYALILLHLLNLRATTTPSVPHIFADRFARNGTLANRSISAAPTVLQAPSAQISDIHTASFYRTLNSLPPLTM